MWAAWGTILRGWALTEQGKIDEGITQIRQGLAAHQATGAEATHPQYLALLAEGYRKADKVEEGLKVLAEALAKVDRTGERYYEAEIYRLKGELTLQEESKEQGAQSKEQEAEACFLKAIDIARKQQAKSLELRAVMSLVRLRQQQALVQSAKRKAQKTRNT